jgi:hypothetical protein
MWSIIGLILVIGASISQLCMGMHEESGVMWLTTIASIVGCIMIKAGELFEDNWKEPVIGIAVITIGIIGFCQSGWDAMDIPRLLFCIGGLIMFDFVWKIIKDL